MGYRIIMITGYQRVVGSLGNWIMIPHGCCCLQFVCQVRWASLKIINPLDTLEVFVSAVQALGAVHLLGVENLPRVKIVFERLLPLLSFLLGVVPGLLQLADVGLQELGTLGVLHQTFTLHHELLDSFPLVFHDPHDGSCRE